MALRDWFRFPRKQAPKRNAAQFSTRMYATARPSRLRVWSASNTSADSELSQSLTNLRTRSRQLVRDTSYARRARSLVINNVVGTGMNFQAKVENTRGGLRTDVNDSIESAWKVWSRAENCHTGGRLSFADIERLSIGEVFEAGEFLIRKHYRPFGTSSIPFSLEVIESERLADDCALTVMAPNEFRLGVEVNEFGRPVAYHIKRRFPSEIAYGPAITDYVERVPADQIIHLAPVDRWPQTRGVPWLHAAANRLADMDGYADAEITRARTQALTPWAIETPQGTESFGEVQSDGAVEMEMQSGTALRLNPGEELKAGPSGAPNPAADPFMRLMLREFAAGVDVSYESVSRDYSQSNYSSSRLALLDDRDVWKHLQQWLIRTLREPIYREWLQQATLVGAVSIPTESFFLDSEKWTRAKIGTRGWEWIDPEKEEAANAAAIRDGMTTLTDVLAAKGVDFEDYVAQRKAELDALQKAGLVLETSPESYDKPEPAPTPAATDPAEPAPTRVYKLR